MTKKIPHPGSGQIAGPSYLHQRALDLMAQYEHDKEHYAAKPLHRKRRNPLRKKGKFA